MKYNKINETPLKYSYLTPEGKRMTTFIGDTSKLELFIKKVEEHNYSLSSKFTLDETHHILFFDAEKVLEPA